jgi:hypothetical protein
VSPWAALPADLPVPSTEVAELDVDPAPKLQLVAPHEHTWQLRAVEYDDALEVRRYECEGCAEVLFR